MKKNDVFNIKSFTVFCKSKFLFNIKDSQSDLIDTWSVSKKCINKSIKIYFVIWNINFFEILEYERRRRKFIQI